MTGNNNTPPPVSKMKARISEPSSSYQHYGATSERDKSLRSDKHDPCRLVPVADLMAMDDEDRTPMPDGYDAALWQKADELHHAMALVARDEECVKILYAALATTEGSADGR